MSGNASSSTLSALEKLHNGSFGGALGGEKLSRELAAGFALDAKRAAEDAMKKRAIHTASSYDEFKNLVACASQKPLSAADFAARAETEANRFFTGTAHPCDLALAAPPGGSGAEEGGGGAGDAAVSASVRAAGLARSGGAADAAAWGAPPRSCLELDRSLRRHAAADARSAFLAWLGPGRLGACFKRDVDAPVLGAVISALAGRLRAAAANGAMEDVGATAVELAVGLVSGASPSALGLAVDCLDKAEKAAVGELGRAALGDDRALLERALATS